MLSDKIIKASVVFITSLYQLDCSPSLPTEPQLRLEAAKSTTGKLNVVHVVVVVPHTISFVTSRDVARRPTT